MKKTKKTFDDNEIIFREGDASDTAYEVVSGSVEIAKQGDDGVVRLAILGKGEIFGEMGVLDDRKRNASAKAVGPLSVNAIPRKDFLEAVRDRPELALRIMSKMSERLRDADGKLAGTATDQAAPAPSAPPVAGEGEEPAQAANKGAAKPGLMEKLLGFKKPIRAEKVQILVAPLLGDDGAALARKAAKALERRKGLRVKTLRKPLNLDPDTRPEEQTRTALGLARTILADADADLLIWGEVPPPGVTVHLKFISFASWNDDPPGAFHSDATLPLPAKLDDPFGDFLYAITLAAIVPQSDEKAATLMRDLPLALDTARPTLEMIPGDLTRRERGQFHASYANALARVAAGRGELGLYKQAAATYRECLAVFSEADTPLEWAFAQKNLGLVLQNLGERKGDEEALGEAVDACRAALRQLNKDDHPLDWAATQNRLGEILYRSRIGHLSVPLGNINQFVNQ